MTNYKRVLIKISGESLAGETGTGLDSAVLTRISEEIKELLEHHIEVAIVVGGGNFYRGLQGSGKENINRVDGDYMGMLATVMNAIALKDYFHKQGVPSQVMSALKVEKVSMELYPPKAVALLKKGEVVIFAGGTGNPFFTTDTAGVLRAVEIGADAMLKATRVDGIYTDDPEKNSDAVKFDKISYDEALNKNLKVMDMTAFALARENKLPIIVFNFNRPGSLKKIILENQALGTLVQ